jgi:hypothetical protein
MDMKKVIDLLAKNEWGDGADYVALELEKLLTNPPANEEELADKLFDIYFEDRSQTWHRAQSYLKQKDTK